MLEALKFVQGAIARKDYVPALTHFHIHNGRALGYNGAIALCSPIDVDLECNPRAASFVKAVQMCDDTIQLNMTPNGRLAIKSGSFSAFVECLEGSEYPSIAPDGQDVEIDGAGLVEALRALLPFVAQDASRPWARGILFRGCSAFATNNVVLVERWLGSPFPVELNIPEEAIKELLRVGDPPVRLQVCEGSATFHFPGDRWMRCQLYSTQWPNVEPVLNKESNQAPLPESFFPALEKLVPFVDDEGRCFFRNGAVATAATEGDGAAVVVPGLAPQGCFNLKLLQSLESVASSVDFSLYPGPCLFYGDRLRGAIVGMRF